MSVDSANKENSIRVPRVGNSRLLPFLLAGRGASRRYVGFGHCLLMLRERAEFSSCVGCSRRYVTSLKLTLNSWQPGYFLISCSDMHSDALRAQLCEGVAGMRCCTGKTAASHGILFNILRRGIPIEALT